MSDIVRRGDGTDTRICRCLLRDDPSQQELMRTVSEYVASIPSGLRVCDAAYKARLETCARCGHIVSGICRLCGCYVEVRAVKRRMGCPDIPSQWGAQHD
ncbi:MAG: DUF6171 family protein [Oscillospiraceae bacterium]|nr:DUF6171 family protein [Oscillospiraceae bacterium]